MFVYYFAYGPVCDDEAKIRGLTKDWTHGAPIHIVTTVYRTPLALLVQNGSSSSVVLLLPSAVLRCAVLTGCTALHCTARSRSGNWASHAAEIAWVWGDHPACYRNQSEQRLTETMQELWTSFAKTGLPRASGVEAWTPYSELQGNVMVLGGGLENQIKMAVHHKEKDCALMLSPEFGCGAPPAPPPPAPAPASAAAAASGKYSASLVHFDDTPVVSYVGGSSDFAQVFNPSWVVASPGTKGKAVRIHR